VDVMNENFATKSDIADLKWSTESKFQALESTMKEIEYKLTIKLGTLMAISIGVTATLVNSISCNILQDMLFCT
jgi:hypothetical protein